MDIERHAILLAVRALRRLPVGGAEVTGLDAGRTEFLGCQRAHHALRHAERHARFMVGHDIGTLARRRRGLHLGVKRRAPFRGGGVDLDLAGVLLVEFLEHRLHADAVAAAQKIPPDDGVFGARRTGGKRQASQGREKGFSDYLDFLPKMARRLPRVTALGFRTVRLSKSLAGMVTRKARGAKEFQSANLIRSPWNNFKTWPKRHHIGRRFFELCANKNRLRSNRLVSLPAAARSRSSISTFLILNERNDARLGYRQSGLQDRDNRRSPVRRLPRASGASDLHRDLRARSQERRRQRDAQGRHRPRSRTESSDRSVSWRQFRLGLQLGRWGGTAREAPDPTRSCVAHVRVQPGRCPRIR